MLAEEPLISKENEIDTLKIQVSMYKENSEKYKAKTQAKKQALKIKLNTKKEIIAAMRAESETRNAELAELKVKISTQSKN